MPSWYDGVNNRMTELQATVEFSVELHKFYNVDLFQRGLYQVRTTLKVSPKLSVKVEVNLARNQKSECVYPPSIINGWGVSKTFQILYRNEEVLLDNVIMFRAHLLVDSHKIEETLERADFNLNVELWFFEQAYTPEAMFGQSCVSMRTLQLHFSPTKGLHYHLPVLFDYFHLAAVTMTIHATLVALHQPYINTPRSAKPLFGNSYRLHPRHPQSAVDTFLFGNINSTKCVSSGSRLAHARHVHQEVCSILLATYETLQSHLQEYMKLLPAWQQLKLETSDCMKRLNNLSEFAKACHRNLAEMTSRTSADGPSNRTKLVDGEEDFISIANSDIAQLCAENILLWHQFLETFSCKDPVHQHLAKAHHHLRVKRFSEAFFVVDNPRQSAAGCYDANYQNYLAVSEMVRRSRYLASLPPLPVMCVELDGDLTTMPIIFEDQYQDVAEFARRRSGASRKSGSDPFLNLIGEKVGPRLTNEEDCSCGIVAILESRSQKIGQGRSAVSSNLPRQPNIAMSMGVLGIEEKRLENGIVTATLTTSKNGEVSNISTLPLRYNGQSYRMAEGEQTKSLPARHSKSLDQLKHTGLRHQPTLPGVGSAPSPSYITRSTSSTMPSNHHHHHHHRKPPIPIGSKPAKHNGAATSPSTDSGESTPLVGRSKKLEQSLSVPYNLCEYPVMSNGGDEFSTSKRIKHSESTLSMPSANDMSSDRFMDNIRVLLGNSSESMPNLVQSPPFGSPKHQGLFPKKRGSDKDPLALYEIGNSTIVEEIGDEHYTLLADTKTSKLGDTSLSSPPSSSISDDITSEQSGWVSNSSRHSSGSRSSSGALSPDLAAFCRSELPDYSTLRLQQDSAGPFPVDPLFDGDRLVEKLEKLAVESGATGQGYEELQVPPPQQFRDVPPPPEPFRDPPTQPSAPNCPPQHSQDSVDNLLYHVYEGVKEANKREQESKKKSKNLKTSLENIMYDLVKESKRRDRLYKGGKRRQGRDKKSKVTSDEGFDEIEARYPDSDTSTVDSFNTKEHKHKNHYRMKNPFQGYLFKEDIETLKKTLEGQKDKANGVEGERRLSKDLMEGLGVETKTEEGEEKKLECDCFDKDDRTKQRSLEDETLTFIKAKEEFKRQMNFTGMIYSDFPTLASTLPYFHISDEYRMFSPEGLHLIVCVHGLDGNSADLRLVKTYLELGLPGANLEFVMSERNQGDTFSDFDTMTDKLVAEILYHVDTCGLTPSKISFIGHSLGNIIIRSAITRPQMKHLLSRFHTFLSLSGPHLGTLYNNSGLVNMGMWFMQKWKKSGSLLQLSLRDAPDMRQSFLYRLSQKSNLHHFRHVLLCGSSQDRYVPMHSARIELCKAAIKDTTVQGAVYREMIHNIMYPVINSADTTLVRYDIHHALPNTANSLIGRAAHIAVLDSELFIEKFLVVTGLKYFR